MGQGSAANERVKRLRHVAASLNELARDRFDPGPLIVVYGDPADPVYGSYEACQQALQEIEAAADHLEEPRRRTLVREMARALSTFAREGAGEALSYANRVEAYAGVPGVPAAAAIVQAMQRTVSAKLARLGYGGPIQDALGEWRSSQRIDPSELEERIDQWVEESRALADERIVKLPAGCSLKTELVHGVFFQGYSEYHGRYRGTVRVNADLPWTEAGLKALIAHEGYAGHFLLSVVSEERARQGRLAPESSFYFANTPTWPIIEGTCNIGLHLLGWFRDTHDEIQEVLSRLRSALLINIAFLRHEQRAGDDEIFAVFCQGGFYSWEQAEQALRFIDHPLFHPSIPAYWHGTREALDALHVGSRMTFQADVVEQLYCRTHTCATLRAWMAVRCGLEEHASTGQAHAYRGDQGSEVGPSGAGVSAMTLRRQSG